MSKKYRIPEWLSKQREKAANSREKRKANLREIELKHIETSLTNRLQKPPKISQLRSVHKDLEHTPSKDYCSSLKEKQTEAELLVDKYLKKLNRQFVSQMPIKNDFSFYIIDFYIPRYKLCIEVDGGYHNLPEQKWRDEQRDKWLVKHGYKVLRFTNEEVMICTFQQFRDTLRRYELYGK
jgi:very-short-patch-repair endonuclease